MTQSPSSTIGTKSTDAPITNRRDLLAGAALAGLADPACRKPPQPKPGTSITIIMLPTIRN